MSGPASTIVRLIEAINNADLDGAASCYDRNAVLVVEPGQFARGPAEVRAALAGFIAMKATFRLGTQQVIEAGDTALHVCRWDFRGTNADGGPVVLSGESTDLLRRQGDGAWLILLDNPWGVGILPPK